MNIVLLSIFFWHSCLQLNYCKSSIVEICSKFSKKHSLFFPFAGTNECKFVCMRLIFGIPDKQHKLINPLDSDWHRINESNWQFLHCSSLWGISGAKEHFPSSFSGKNGQPPWLWSKEFGKFSKSKKFKLHEADSTSVPECAAPDLGDHWCWLSRISETSACWPEIGLQNSRKSRDYLQWDQTCPERALRRLY